MSDFFYHNFYLFSGLLQVVLSFILARRITSFGFHRKGNREFVTFMFSLALVGIFYCAAATQADAGWYFFLWRFSVAPMVFILPCIYLNFVASFTEWRQWEKIWVKAVFFCPALFFVCMDLFFPGFFYAGTLSNAFGYIMSPTPRVVVFMAYWLIMTVTTLVIIFRRFRPLAFNKKTVTLFIIGNALSFFLSVFFDQILPQFTPDYPELGFLGINIYSIFLYAIVSSNQRLFDVERALIDFEKLKYFDKTSSALNAEIHREELLQLFVENARKAAAARSVLYMEITRPDLFRLSHFSGDEKSVLYQVVEYARQHNYRLFNQHSLKDIPVSYIREVLKTGETQTIKSMHQLLGELLPFVMTTLFDLMSGVQYRFAVPVTVLGEIRGILIFSLLQEEEDLTIYRLFANQCAQIIRNSELLESYKKARDEQSILLNNISTLIWYFKDAETFGRINNAFVSFFNLEPGDVGGRPIREILEKHPSLEGMISRSSQVFETRQKVEFEEWLVNHAGEKRLFLITQTPKLNASGGIDYAVCVGNDITELRKFETQLYQAQKMEAVGQLAGGVAHNFNNLLLSIMGYAELIAGESEGTRAAQFANRIIMASQHGSSLSQQLLTFARKGKYETAVIDITHTVDEVISLIQNTFDKKIRIEKEFAEPRASTSGDPSQLMQMLLNLALNARDAMPDGGVIKFLVDERTLDEAFCRKNEFAKPGRFLHIAVSDTGAGITKDVQPHIFEPFFTTKEVGKGFGLGLASVYGCIKNHSGYITLESVPGQGTQFDIYLPTAARPPEAEKQDAPPKAAPAHTGNIIIIEDEEDVRTVTALTLRKAGFAVQSFGNGPAALAFYKENHESVDAVLLDVTMPEMGGLECLQALMGINPAVRVIIASGHTFEGEPHLLIEKGARAFIQKPWKRADLIRIIDEGLAKK